jgi:hypothetical protein
MLDNVGMRGRALPDVLRDLAWASRARRSDSTVTGLTWRDGNLDVTARGEDSPFLTEDRIVVPRPSGPGAKVWSIGPARDRR